MKNEVDTILIKVSNIVNITDTIYFIYEILIEQILSIPGVVKL